jgi:hypothetical protein
MAPDPYALYDQARAFRNAAECAKERAIMALYRVKVVGVSAAEARFNREMSSVSALNGLAENISLKADRILISARQLRSFRRAWYRHVAIRTHR